jgi:hypothetical protein
MLRQSQFCGFYNCLYVIMVFYFFVAPLLKYKEKGVLFDVTLLHMMKRDLPLVMVTWPLVLNITNPSFICGATSL